MNPHPILLLCLGILMYTYLKSNEDRIVAICKSTDGVVRYLSENVEYEPLSNVELHCYNDAMTSEEYDKMKVEIYQRTR